MAEESSTSVTENLDVIIEDPLLQRLYRIFTVFSDSQHHISPYQAHFIIGQLSRLNHGTEQAQNGLSTLIRSDAVTFYDLLRICDLLFPDRKQFEPLVDRTFERFVQQIICKKKSYKDPEFISLCFTCSLTFVSPQCPFSTCRLTLLTNSYCQGFLLYCIKSNRKKQCLIRNNSKWRAYWCTITPGAIHLWPLNKSTTVKNRKTVVIDQTSAVQVDTFDEERFTWILTIQSKQKYQFGHFDELQRKQWIFAMNLAIERRSMNELQKFDRECSRKAECRLLPDKNLSWRLALEFENERLMRLLDDQQKALHDEEIVRTLAARMLDEERERREKLEEKLQDLVSDLNENCDNNSLMAKGSLDG